MVGARAPAGPWWRGLGPPDAPQIIARLPFVERPDHPAGMPAFVIAQPLAEAAARDVVLYDVTITHGARDFPPGVGARGVEILGRFRRNPGSRRRGRSTDRRNRQPRRALRFERRPKPGGAIILFRSLLL